MLFGSLFAGLCLATALEATPIQQDDAHREIVRFKRDAILSARDFELADMHGVNLTEMWKHSVVKRHDGDDVTIWIDNNYEEPEGPENILSKRQTAHLWPSAHFRDSPGGHNCRQPQRFDITSATSPFTGGVLAMAAWAREHNGYFLIGTDTNGYQFGPGAGGWGWRTILIGGSNGGRNARYRMAVGDPKGWNFAWVSTPDIVDDLNWTHDRRRVYNGQWRAASHGNQWCGPVGGGSGVWQEFEIISFDQPV